MAAGKSTRKRTANKLLLPFRGVPMIRYLETPYLKATVGALQMTLPALFTDIDSPEDYSALRSVEREIST